MEFFQQIIDFVLHLDAHLSEMVAQYGLLTYVILFLIIFSETGLVIFPFLPGDSLLFAAGALAAKGDLNVLLLLIVLFGAAVLGNTVNYFIGKSVGPRIFSQEHNRFIKKAHLIRAQEFYDKYGVPAIILSRFLPIFRTFVPFIAGITQMNWAKYTLYNMLGAALWVVPIVFLGYKFGNLPIVRDNFTLVILFIVIITILPPIIGFLMAKFRTKPETE